MEYYYDANRNGTNCMGQVELVDERICWPARCINYRIYPVWNKCGAKLFPILFQH